MTTTTMEPVSNAGSAKTPKMETVSTFSTVPSPLPSARPAFPAMNYKTTSVKIENPVVKKSIKGMEPVKNVLMGIPFKDLNASKIVNC